jgi:hypothetical protein
LHKITAVYATLIISSGKGPMDKSGLSYLGNSSPEKKGKKQISLGKVTTFCQSIAQSVNSRKSSHSTESKGIYVLNSLHDPLSANLLTRHRAKRG